MLGWFARGGWHARGQASLPSVTIAGNITATGRIWAKGLGSAAAPALAIGVLGNEGWYSGSAGQMHGVTAGALKLAIESALLYSFVDVSLDTGKDLAISAGGQIKADYGTAAEPGYSFNGRASDGFYSAAAGYLGMHTGATLLGATISVSDIYMASTMRYAERATAPSAAADYATIYAIDLAGKTQWNFLAPTGVFQQIKVEA